MPYDQPEVALLAEGVDRNCFDAGCRIIRFVSPSSQRAWIEMHEVSPEYGKCSVALLAEGVDRNFLAPCPLPMMDRSPSSQRAWIEIRLASL